MLSVENQRRALRRAVRRHLKSIGLSVNGTGSCVPVRTPTKEEIRRLHGQHRKRTLARDRLFLKVRGRSLLGHFADGGEVDPARISPYLEVVETGTESADAFRLACLTWSVPVSKGFGRRIRCLVRDEQNGKVMGILALTDPVFNLRARDQWIGWNEKDRRERLIHVMDAYVLGSLPPYSRLLCGKLIASLVASKELATVFKNKYRNSHTIISERTVSPRLALISTTSALGRSSVYNRLKFKDRLLFVPIGMTLGYGHFHFPDSIVLKFRSLLRAVGHKYADGHRFGKGPNWRIRVIREGLNRIGLSQEILRHGIERQVFAVPLLKNTKEFLRGERKRAFSAHIPCEELTSFCLERWILRRASWDSSYKEFDRTQLLEMILANGARTSEELAAA